MPGRSSVADSRPGACIWMRVTCSALLLLLAANSSKINFHDCYAASLLSSHVPRLCPACSISSGDLLAPPAGHFSHGRESASQLQPFRTGSSRSGASMMQQRRLPAACGRGRRRCRPGQRRPTGTRRQRQHRPSCRMEARRCFKGQQKSSDAHGARAACGAAIAVPAAMPVATQHQRSKDSCFAGMNRRKRLRYFLES